MSLQWVKIDCTMFVFSIFVKQFLDESSGRESCRFSRFFFKFYPQLNIFHFSYDVISQLKDYNVEYSFLFPSLQKL